MTARDSTPDLDALGAKCQEVPMDKGARVLVVSSPSPPAVMASALLCRSIMKAKGFFHVTFIEPVSSSEVLASIMNTNPERTTIVLGIDITGNGTLDSKHSPLILIGSTIQKRHTSCYSLGSKTSVPASAYAFAREKMETGPEELFLGAAALLIQNQQMIESDPASKDVIRLAQATDILQERRGFRIFGANFLPLSETLSNSISPYLRGISGAPESCERVLSEADIPSARRNVPITSLTSEEKKRLTEKLALQLDISVIRKLLGLDFETRLEPESSPMHFLSGIQSMAEVAWCRQEVGLAMAIWMGDRARMMRMLLDSYRIHCKGTISGVQHFLSVQVKHEIRALSDLVSIAPLAGVSTEVLPDVGRIAIENGHIDKDRFLVLEKDDYACVVWASEDVTLSDVLTAFDTAGLSPLSTSTTSVLVPLTSKENRETLLRAVDTLPRG